VNGGVRCWGDNTYKQLGAASGSESATPLQVPGLESGVEAIAAGDTYTCALVNGGVRCWGEGTDGFLGDGSASEHTRATPYATIAESSGATALASSYGTTCALVGDQVQCWGYAAVGISGTGCAGGFCSSPRPLITAPAGTTSLQLGLANLYLLVNGGVKALGADGFGELGNGDPTAASTPLVDVSGLTSGVRDVSSRLSSTCALLTTGQVRCWGLNAENQLGDGTITNRTAPVGVHGL
jgi:alpha-tubulin suppressor-like RCC1 family protein